MGKIQFTCELCSKEFFEYRSNRVKKHIFCSKECSNQNKLGSKPWNKGFGKYMKGERNHYFGKKHTKEELKKMSKVHKGQPVWNKGVKQWEGKIHPNLGMKHTDEARAKISKALIGKHPWNYAGSIGRTERQIAMAKKDYILWRTAVFMRDDYTCQTCKQRGITLNADHIKPWAQYPELRYAIDNGRTLCVDCHKQTDTWGFKGIPRNERRVTYVR
jgi:hypothetical protein